MQKLWKADLTFASRFRKIRRTLFMHSPLEIARNYIEVGIHKVNLSIFKTILLGFFAGMFIGKVGGRCGIPGRYGYGTCSGQ